MLITEVGLKNQFSGALIDLLKLDYAMLAAYDVALLKLENPIYISELKQFKEDHHRHILQINNLLLDHGIEPPTPPDLKQYLTKCAIYIATLFGDEAILLAMNRKEKAANAAYHLINHNLDRWPEATCVLRRGLEDETAHDLWVKNILHDDSLRIKMATQKASLLNRV